MCVYCGGRTQPKLPVLVLLQWSSSSGVGLAEIRSLLCTYSGVLPVPGTGNLAHRTPLLPGWIFFDGGKVVSFDTSWLLEEFRHSAAEGGGGVAVVGIDLGIIVLIPLYVSYKD